MDEQSGIDTKLRLRGDFTLAQLEPDKAKFIRERRQRHKLTFKETTRQAVRERHLAKDEMHRHDAHWKAQKNSFAAKLDYRPSRSSSDKYLEKVKNEYRASHRSWEKGRERLESFHQHVKKDLRRKGRTLCDEFRKKTTQEKKIDYSRKR